MSNIELVGLKSGKHLGEDEAAAICPLLTPSTPLGEQHLADSTPPVLAYDVEREPISINTAVLSTLSGIEPCIDVSPPINIPGGGKKAELVDCLQSSSSNSSVLRDTTFLTTHNFMNDSTFQENGGVKPSYYTFQLGNGKAPPEYNFISWNWPLIRKLCFCGVISTMVACLCVVVTFISMLPTKCDPPKEWYQGSLFYEIFPASFKDTNSDGLGDLKGIKMKIPYLKSLKVKCVRLNSVFSADHYPDFYENVKNYTQIDKTLGSLDDMDILISSLHNNGISIVLDLPLTNVFLSSDDSKIPRSKDPNSSYVKDSKSFVSTEQSQMRVENILNFWLDRGIDGFYIKGLEYFTSSPYFLQDVSNWKSVLRFYSTFDHAKIMICSNNVLTKLLNENSLSQNDKLVTVLKSFDLIDVLLNSTNVADLRSQINGVLKGVTFSKMDYPWIHWSVGNVESSRITARVEALNASLAALFINLMLPGTPSIFYGDELGLTNIVDQKKEFSDVHHIHQVTPMHWSDGSFSGAHNYSWLPRGQPLMIGRLRTLANFMEIRDRTPSIYSRGTIRGREMVLNCAIDRYADEYVLIVERTYPRRNSIALIANLRDEAQTKDLSSLYFGGYVLGGISHFQDGQYLQFHSLTVYPGEALIVNLDK